MKVLTEKEIDDIRAEAKAELRKEFAENFRKNKTEWESAIRAEALRVAADRAIDWFKGIGLGVSGLKSAHDELRSAILSANPSTDEGGARECVWTEDPDGLWSTSCGRSWTFIEGGPEENGIRYCHGCGKPVLIADEPNKEE